MTCNEICINYKVEKPYPTGRYEAGQKRCSLCVIWIKWDGASCPCCNSTLRTKPRNSNDRIRLQEVNLIKRIN